MRSVARIGAAPALAAALALAGALCALPAQALPPVTGAPPPACDLSGEWLGTATDDAGTRWTFPFHATQTGHDLVARIEWSGSDGHTGTERVRGIVDCAARTLEMHTELVTGPDLAAGLYHATLSADLRTITGRWDGPNVVPGRFTLRRR